MIKNSNLLRFDEVHYMSVNFTKSKKKGKNNETE